MVSPSRKTRPSAVIMSSSHIQNHDIIKHQIIMLTSCALSLFIIGTLILMTKMPYPSTRHSVDTVVKSPLRLLKDDQSRRAAVVEFKRKRSRPNELKKIKDRYRLKDEDNASINNDKDHAAKEFHEKEYKPVLFNAKLQEKIPSKHKLRTVDSNSPSPPRLIHILETRFMQNQPTLVELAKARLHLFSTICLPTVIKQSSWGEFIWVIRTDIDLDEQIKKDLVSLLKSSGALNKVTIDKDGQDKRSLTYVVGSNDNYIIANSTTYQAQDVQPFDIRHMLSNMVSNPQSLFAGEISSAQSLLNEINTKKTNLDDANDDVILWTRLDADDGLNLGYMEYIQNQAIRFFLPDYYGKKMSMEVETDRHGNVALPHELKIDSHLIKKKNYYTPPKWTYWCAGRNIDWFITDPIHDPLHRNGTVYPVQHVNVCVTPGVTVALRGTFDPIKVPRLDHDKIISYLRPRGPKLCARSGISVFEEDEKDSQKDSGKEEPDDGSCFHMVNAYYFAALRSRTPTSAGMLGVSPNDMQMMIVKKQPILTYAMWVLMVREFGISDKALVDTNNYFVKHVYDIAEENARGQCTQGHSCKTSSKDLLQQYADLKREMQDGFDVVNGTLVKQ